MVERFRLKLHQQSPCYYELIDTQGELETSFGFNITFDDGAKADIITKQLNKQETQIKELNDKLEPLINICIDYNLTLEQLPELIEECIEREGEKI